MHLYVYVVLSNPHIYGPLAPEHISSKRYIRFYSKMGIDSWNINSLAREGCLSGAIKLHSLFDPQSKISTFQ